LWCFLWAEPEKLEIYFLPITSKHILGYALILDSRTKPRTKDKHVFVLDETPYMSGIVRLVLVLPPVVRISYQRANSISGIYLFSDIPYYT
jgi:hypothetical protein